MRQIHHWAAIVFLAAIVVHLCRIFFTGAFRQPREINWIVGVTLLLLGHRQRVHRLLAARRPAVGHRPADRVLDRAVDPADRHLARLPALRRQLSRDRRSSPGCSSSTCCSSRPLIVALLTAHLAILWHQKHTDFPGPGRTEDNIAGSRLWPQYTAKSVGLFCFVLAVLAALGGLVQINPIWLYGPYHPAAVSSGSQPDWYVGWLDGALRVFPTWEIRAFGHTIANPFFPGVLLPGITFGLLYAWPFLEQRFTKDRASHNLLDRPRDRPLRTAFGVATLTFYTVLFLAGGTDVLAASFSLTLEAVLRTFQILLLVLPVVTGLIAWRICKELSRQRLHPIWHPVGRHRGPGAVGGLRDGAGRPPVR